MGLNRIAEQFSTPAALLRAGEVSRFVEGSIEARVYHELRDERWQAVLAQIANIGICWGHERPNLSAGSGLMPLVGKTIVITGNLKTLSRDRAKEMAELAGAKTTTAVSRKTDLVVAGPGAGSKLTDAQTLGVGVINEAEFLGLLRTSGVLDE